MGLWFSKTVEKYPSKIMINFIPLPKLLTVFAILYFFIVIAFSYLFPIFGINLSDIRIASFLGIVVELILLYLFSSGWQKIWTNFPKLNEWIFPDLNGKWKAEIEWNWNGETGTKQGTAYIKQSLTKFSIDVDTDESESSTLMVKLSKDAESERPALYYMYRSESKSTSNDNIEEHKGAAILKLHFDDISKISGNYFTDRKTYGRYTFTRD